MSSSPAWLTVALTSLATDRTSDPSIVLSQGIRSLPSPHVLHHLNRWARHVWRPAVTSRSLAALTRLPAAESLEALGPGAVALLAALVEAVRRCGADKWLDVLGVMFLADDPWAVEVGRIGDAKDVDRAAAALRVLFEKKAGLLAEVASQSALDVADVLLDVEAEGSGQSESFAELRCRVAALQLQLDDVTAVVRRNEKNTKDLLSSFHFWSMLLLDELRSYKTQLAGRSAETSLQGNGSHNMKAHGEGVFDSFARHVGQAVTSSAAESSSDGSKTGLEGAPTTSSAIASTVPAGEPPRAKRIFRDGKWVVV